MLAKEKEEKSCPAPRTREKYGEGGGNKGGRDNNAKPWQGVGRIRVRPIQRSRWIRSRRDILSLRIRVRS
jgi:hypothetical protein